MPVTEDGLVVVAEAEAWRAARLDFHHDRNQGAPKRERARLVELSIEAQAPPAPAVPVPRERAPDDAASPASGGVRPEPRVEEDAPGDRSDPPPASEPPGARAGGEPVVQFDTATLGLQRARARETEAKAGYWENRLAEQTGRLVDRGLVERVVDARARLERNSWQAWAARLAPELALKLEADGEAVRQELADAVRDQLAELARMPLEIRPEPEGAAPVE